MFHLNAGPGHIFSPLCPCKPLPGPNRSVLFFFHRALPLPEKDSLTENNPVKGTQNAEERREGSQIDSEERKGRREGDSHREIPGPGEAGGKTSLIRAEAEEEVLEVVALFKRPLTPLERARVLHAAFTELALIDGVPDCQLHPWHDISTEERDFCVLNTDERISWLVSRLSS